MKISHLRSNSDTLGIVASSLCLVHCLVTPFLFIAHTGIIIFREINPIWWKSLDFVFLGISFIAIHRTTKTTSKPKIKFAFWIGWSLLFLTIMNEKLGIIELGEGIMYMTTLFLAGLHFYNQKYCSCENEKCCNN